ncbi:MAG TPA: dehydrogenase E1 component subunit alpha/beta [Candidatus Polarisedimenticolia bacterium]|nr:dehydrogenase E1 component subunit alpha/beta [Candidatus Polarisedimenticolia bacterium]
MKNKARARTEVKEPGLDRQTLLAIYRNMILSRRIDDKQIQLKRQNKIFFQIAGAGHEAVLTAAGMVLKPGHDWFYAYYRDMALMLQLGMTPLEIMLEALGAADDPNSGGRQMPSHWGHPRLNIVSKSSCTGTQYLQSVGCSQAGRYVAIVKECQERGFRFQKDEVTYVSGGEGSTSEGEFWEALNTACNLKLPMLFLIEDNKYAISVPVEVQTAGGTIKRLVQNWPNLRYEEIDGCDPLESHRVLSDVVGDLRRRREGPALVQAHCIRPYSHSLSDDERLYKPERERQEEAKRDPIVRHEKLLLEEKIADPAFLQQMRESVEREVDEATEQAIAAAIPGPETITQYVYSSEVDPTSSRFSTEPRLEGDPKTMVDLLNACLRDEMARDPRIVIFGEDVADATREEALGEVKGKGGVFKVTHNLQRRFGKERVFNSPLAEANIVGRAIGMATRGLKPVVEIQFMDYIWPAFMQIRDELSLLRWRSNNGFSCPLVIRVASGGYLGGGAPYHSQSGEVFFTHTPGLRVVMPATALDANGLLRTAIRSDDPVIFMEHKHLYRQTYNKSPYPGPEFCIPFGKARVVEEGTDLSLITYGATVERSLRAARQVREEIGTSVEVIDLRSLSPFDWDAVEASVRKTGKALVVHEDCLTFGFGAEMAALIGDRLFEYLDGPVRRVGAADTFVAYQPKLEEVILPQIPDIHRAILDLAKY